MKQSSYPGGFFMMNWKQMSKVLMPLSFLSLTCVFADGELTDTVAFANASLIAADGNCPQPCPAPRPVCPKPCPPPACPKPCPPPACPRPCPPTPCPQPCPPPPCTPVCPKPCQVP